MLHPFSEMHTSAKTVFHKGMQPRLRPATGRSCDVLHKILFVRCDSTSSRMRRILMRRTLTATSSAGEYYRQAAVDWNPFGFSASDPQVTTDVDTLVRGTFESDELYRAAAVTQATDSGDSNTQA